MVAPEHQKLVSRWVIWITLVLVVWGSWSVFGPAVWHVVQARRGCDAPFVISADGTGIISVNPESRDWQSTLRLASVEKERCATLQAYGSTTLGEHSDIDAFADEIGVRIRVERQDR